MLSRCSFFSGEKLKGSPWGTLKDAPRFGQWLDRPATFDRDLLQKAKDVMPLKLK